MTESLLLLLIELQELEILQPFALAGGTNLALRFQHRQSVDIDLFTSEQIGVEGCEKIQQILQEKYGKDLLFSEIINREQGDQYCFLRCLVKKGDEQIKVEMIQNIQHVDPIETVENMRLFTVKDIGLFKLMAACNRMAQKDIYDLDLVTDSIELNALLKYLAEKLSIYKEDRFKSLFDLDHPKNPVDNLDLLLAFDEIIYEAPAFGHAHSSDRLMINENKKTWQAAKTSWRRKVKNLVKSREN